jgi:hypothetical protein
LGTVISYCSSCSRVWAGFGFVAIGAGHEAALKL